MANYKSYNNQSLFNGVAQEVSGYSTESSRNNTIANEKRARKAVEEDAARLQNRVQTLQKEEQKALKRLEETRSKARDILSLRAQNEQRQLEREQRQQQMQVKCHTSMQFWLSRQTEPPYHTVIQAVSFASFEAVAA